MLKKLSHSFGNEKHSVSLLETHCFNNGNWEFPLLKLIWMFLGVILLVILLFFRVILPTISYT